MSREASHLKRRGVLLATAGLLFALAVGFGLRFLEVTQIDVRTWSLAALFTLAVQFALWLVPARGWDARLGWDPHYIYLPMTAAALLLTLYVFLMPGARVLLLMAWFVALVFVAGIAAFREVVSLSGLMAAGYLTAVALSAPAHPAIDLRFELVVTGVFFGICGYAAFVFQRHRRQREEMRALRQELAEQAHTDALTGLPNRRRFEVLLREELSRIARYGGSCSIAMLDVDHFKRYNDTLGHPAGDRVLRRLAEIFRENLREPDVAARYGGEEFALLLVETAVERAREVVERIRAVVEAHEFPGEAVLPTGDLTISAGIASVRDEESRLEAVIERADRALYAAKRAGRNRVHLAA